MGSDLPERADGADGHQVLAPEDRGRGIGSTEQVEHQRRRGSLVVHFHHDGALGRRDAVAPQFFEESASSLARRLDHRSVAEKRDLPMPVGDEVPRREGGPFGVVADDRVGVDAERLAIDEDERRAERLLVEEVALTFADRRQDEPIHPAPQQRLDRGLFALGVVIDARGEDSETALDGGVLDGAVHCGGERIRHARDDEPDRSGLAVGPAQAPGALVGMVLELFDRRVDAGGHLGGHEGLTVGNAGNRLDADAGEGGDILHGRATRRVSHLRPLGGGGSASGDERFRRADAGRPPG